MQKTFKYPVSIEGVGLHSGCSSKLTFNPAPIGSGIIFKRIDLPDQPEISALYNQVVDTRNCTCLGDKNGNQISTIEHVMAALRVAGIDNALIEVNNPELPIMDGSAQPFERLLASAELEEQPAPRKYLKVKKTVSFADDKGNIVTLAPADKFSIRFEIEFPSKIVGHQIFDNEITPEIFASEIAPCRTFCEKYQVDYLRSIGLIKGGSLENAVVLDGENILNPDGFRCPFECVNHKVLDAIGDLYTSGHFVLGRLEASKTGHYHNNELLKVLFSDPANYELL